MTNTERAAIVERAELRFLQALERVSRKRHIKRQVHFEDALNIIERLFPMNDKQTDNNLKELDGVDNRLFNDMAERYLRVKT